MTDCTIPYCNKEQEPDMEFCIDHATEFEQEFGIKGGVSA